MLRDFPYANPSQAALNFARNSQIKVKDADGHDTTLAALYQTYRASPITNTPADTLGTRSRTSATSCPTTIRPWVEVKGSQ
jgi:hypothetical protein